MSFRVDQHLLPQIKGSFLAVARLFLYGSSVVI